MIISSADNPPDLLLLSTSRVSICSGGAGDCGGGTGGGGGGSGSSGSFSKTQVPRLHAEEPKRPAACLVKFACQRQKQLLYCRRMNLHKQWGFYLYK